MKLTEEERTQRALAVFTLNFAASILIAAIATFAGVIFYTTQTVMIHWTIPGRVSLICWGIALLSLVTTIPTFIAALTAAARSKPQ